MSEPQKYRKKPVVIEAMRWDGRESTKRRILAWAGRHVHGWSSLDFLRIATLEGDMRADIGDFIIKGVQGEFYPCKPDIFEATYEPAGTSTCRTIPWPPSDELVETVASMLEATDGGDYDAIARAMLDAIEGEA